MADGIVSVMLADLPMAAACYDGRGKLLGCSLAATSLLQRWPDLGDRFVMMAVGSRISGSEVVQRGGEAWQLHLSSVIHDGVRARLIVALYTPPPRARTRQMSG